MCRANGMSIAPYSVMGGGMFRTPEELRKRADTLRGGMQPTEDQLKLGKVLQEVAEEIGGGSNLANGVSFFQCRRDRLALLTYLQWLWRGRNKQSPTVSPSLEVPTRTICDPTLRPSRFVFRRIRSSGLKGPYRLTLGSLTFHSAGTLTTCREASQSRALSTR